MNNQPELPRFLIFYSDRREDKITTIAVDDISAVVVDGNLVTIVTKSNGSKYIFNNGTDSIRKFGINLSEQLSGIKIPDYLK